MKKLHLIHAKNLTDIQPKFHDKLMPVLEKETLEWAQKFKADAYKATIEVQQEFTKDPKSFNNKYFRYLRRLLELRLDYLEKQAGSEDKSPTQLTKELIEYLNIESLNVFDYISCSQVQMYEFCPRKWFLKYALGIKTPKAGQLHFGTAVDEALNFWFEERIKGNKVPIDAVNAIFYEVFNKEKEDVVWGKANPAILEKSGPAVIEAYINEFDKITNPKEIQAEAIIHLEGGGYLKGYLDILEENAVVDTKTAAKPWETSGRYAKHLEELQPKAYSLWFYEEFNKIPEFRYQIVTKDIDEKGNPKPKTQLIKFEVKKFELEAFRRRITNIWKSIQESLPKGKPGFMAQADPKARGDAPGYGIGKQKLGVLCCKQFCEYADICIKDGLKIPLRWESKTETTPGHHVYEEDEVKKDEGKKGKSNEKTDKVKNS